MALEQTDAQYQAVTPMGQETEGNHHASVFSGSMLVAGVMIGAGMFSLPVVSSGMWFFWAVLALAIVWATSYFGALMLLETNLRYPRGANLHTLVKDILGPKWNVVTTVAIAFVLYILLYAYSSSGGSIVLNSFDKIFTDFDLFTGQQASVLYGSAIALIVWLGTGLVSRLSVVLLGAMVITFITSTGGLLTNVDAQNLFNSTAPEDTNYFIYIWAALPAFLTSFGCASMVPSLVKYHGHKPKTISKCFFYGSLLALVVYLLWILAVFGNLARTEFIAINEAGGNMGTLVASLEQGNGQSILNYLLQLFSHFAITSSFLGVGLSLFDFVADKFNLDNSTMGRFKAAVITFLPPLIGSYFLPNGFIHAIGYAGFGLFFAYFLVPYLMVRKVRQTNTDKASFTLFGGHWMIMGILVISSIIALCKVLNTFGLLSLYPN